ncbi:unnamed protein product [Macrosiphum euphorbiae]|uniref:BESS domain-containing protein n=1 Tax=Macrosiphum euphorbiae TaxID=13131 RepID=A0AAV0VS65_9HEMI|nr:unnamed protein product [Macrosiphum euphorbiae]
MKSMDDQNNIKFRIDVMQLLQKYTTNDNQTSQPYPPPQHYTPHQPQFQPYNIPLQPYTYTQQTLERNQEYPMANQSTNDIL